MQRHNMLNSIITKSSNELEWTKFQFYDWIPMEIRIQSVRDENWQKIRKSMLKSSLEFKFNTLQKWLKRNKFSKKAKVQTR